MLGQRFTEELLVLNTLSNWRQKENFDQVHARLSRQLSLDKNRNPFERRHTRSLYLKRSKDKPPPRSPARLSCTPETSSLLMKDLPDEQQQQPKSSSSGLHNNDIPSATPYVDVDDDDDYFYAARSRHDPVIRYHSSPPPPTYPLESIPDVVDSESNPLATEPPPFPHPVDLNSSEQKSVASKSTTGGFFKAVREKARKAFPGSSSNNTTTKSTTPNTNLVVNGHAEPEEIEAFEAKKCQQQEFDAQFVKEEIPARNRRGKSPTTAGTAATASSPSNSSTSNYYRRRLKLDLAAKQQQLQQQNEAANSSSTRQQAFRHRKAHTQPLPQQKGVTPLEAALATGAHFASNAGGDEHAEIAFKTALLQVSPHHHAHLLDPSELPPSTSGFCGSTGSLPVVASISHHKHPLAVMSTTEDTPSTSGAESCAGDSVKQGGGGGRSSQPGGATTASPSLETFQRLKNRYCTSFRIHIPSLKNPVDLCMLPNEHIAIADYDNGCVIVNTVGDVIDHKDAPEDKNACGVACMKRDGGRLFVLVFRDGVWSVNIYVNYGLVDSIKCPTDSQIESWALRKIIVAPQAENDTESFFLMASGEAKVSIWQYDFQPQRQWRCVAVENSRKGIDDLGGYNDLSVKQKTEHSETLLLLCDSRKSQLCTLTLNSKDESIDQKSIRVRRVKGQEWIVQGPTLAALDDQSDIIVYDGSGKLFLFDGDTYRCKKIIADIGRGEVSSMFVRDGWVYALCRYRLCIECYLYKEFTETSL